VAWANAPRSRREAHFGDRVVPCFVERPRSVHALLAEAAARNPDGEALVCGAERLTWAEMQDATRRLAGALARRGVQAGDRVALLLGNGTPFVLSHFALARLGAVTVPLSVRLQAPEIAYVLGDCGARLVIHEPELSARLPAAGEVPALERRVAAGENAGAESFAALRSETEPPSNPAAVSEDDTAVVLYTSGTTGKPKGAMLAHLNIVHSAMVYETCMGLTSRDRSVAAVPLSHVTGLIANVVALARCAGTLVILPTFKAADFVQLAARERMTHSLLVPAMYNLCLLQSDFAAHDLSSWRIGGYGGAPMPQATIERLAEQLPGLALMNAYGATETTSPISLMPPEETAGRGDSVGRAVPGATIVAMDEDGCEAPPGAVGELWLSGPSVVKGYWGNPDATAENIVGGFWRSGDLGTVDGDGFVRVLDRKKDMINRGGYKIYTAEVEAVLAGHPEVVESAVVAKPCPVLGERVHAFVVPRSAVSAETLRRFCAERLSDFKVPETVTLQDEPLPRNANGKVVKRTLRETLLAEPTLRGTTA
jgi:acyl-CoA synthetase (AMP-forming)/AMP-acid ligase II